MGQKQLASRTTHRFKAPKLFTFSGVSMWDRLPEPKEWAAEPFKSATDKGNLCIGKSDAKFKGARQEIYIAVIREVFQANRPPKSAGRRFLITWAIWSLIYMAIAKWGWRGDDNRWILGGGAAIGLVLAGGGWLMATVMNRYRKLVGVRFETPAKRWNCISMPPPMPCVDQVVQTYTRDWCG